MKKKERRKILFKISTVTPYTVPEIEDFMYLTGLKIKDTEKVMANLNHCGVTNLIDVNRLVKMGYANFIKSE